MITEEWRIIEDFPDYEVSNTGFVRSIHRRYRNLRGGRSSRGYLLVTMMRDRKSHVRTVHSLVAEAFIPKPDDGRIYEVNHKYGNKDDNSVSNLEWMTHGDNVRHAIATGLIKTKSVRIINTGNSFSSVKECADYLGVSVGYVYGHLNGHFSHCKGFQLELC